MPNDKPTSSDSEAKAAMQRWAKKNWFSVCVETKWDVKTQTGYLILSYLGSLYFAVHGVIFDKDDNIIVKRISSHTTMKGARNAGSNWWAAGEQMMKQFTNGNVIACNRGPYSHHAIYDKERNAVIEYTGKIGRKPKATIKSTPIKEFVLRETGLGLKLSKFSYPKGVVLLDPVDSIKRARLQIGKANYNLLGHNCQHLASYCATGKAQSFDVNMYQKAMGIFSGTVLTGLLAGGAAIGATAIVAPLLAQAALDLLLTPVGWGVLAAGCIVVGLAVGGFIFLAVSEMKKSENSSKWVTKEELSIA